jgi:hypothetical protein
MTGTTRIYARIDVSCCFPHVHKGLALRMKGGRADQALQPHQLMMSAISIAG